MSTTTAKSNKPKAIGEPELAASELDSDIQLLGSARLQEAIEGFRNAYDGKFIGDDYELVGPMYILAGILLEDCPSVTHRERIAVRFAELLDRDMRAGIFGEDFDGCHSVSDSLLFLVDYVTDNVTVLKKYYLSLDLEEHT